MASYKGAPLLSDLELQEMHGLLKEVYKNAAANRKIVVDNQQNWVKSANSISVCVQADAAVATSAQALLEAEREIRDRHNKNNRQTI